MRMRNLIMLWYTGFEYFLSYGGSRRASRAPAGRLLLMALFNYYCFKQSLLRENFDTEFARVHNRSSGSL